MQSTRRIRRQIQSIKSTSQITKAMEMVAASKMRKSQQVALMARPYAQAALEILSSVSESTEPENHTLLEKREVKNIGIVAITSDKGLCGGLNSNVMKETLKLIKKNGDKKAEIIAVGKKAESYFRKIGNISAVFGKMGDTIELKETLPISNLLINDFKNKKYDKVVAVYTNFISTIKQEVRVKTILPITKRSLEETIEEIEDLAEIKNGAEYTSNIEYKFEPSPQEVLEKLLPSLIETQIYHIILESNASEHSARMVAMKNATDSAIEMLGDLNLSYNYLRQQKITQEISEITAGVAALES